MARFGIQVFGELIVAELDHENVVSVREELLRTRYLIGTTVQRDDCGNGIPVEVLIPATSIRWISGGAHE